MVMKYVKTEEATSEKYKLRSVSGYHKEDKRIDIIKG